MHIRPRINRWTAARRELLFGGSMLSSLVQPHFVVAGENVDQPIEGMPGMNVVRREDYLSDYDNAAGGGYHYDYEHYEDDYEDGWMVG